MLISLTLGITGFLCVLNIIFAVAFRKRYIRETLSYLVAGLLELVIFAVALALRLGILTTIPYHLPPGLPFNRSEIGAALAVGIGLCFRLPTGTVPLQPNCVCVWQKMRKSSKSTTASTRVPILQKTG